MIERMSRSLFVKFLSGGLLVIVTLLWARSGGKTGVTKLSASPGCTCHSSTPSSSVTVTLDGVDTLQVGETANYTVTISGGPLKSAGTNVAVSSGTLNTTGSDLQLLNGELTHTAPKLPANGKVTFAFTYTAPQAAGTVTMAANGKSVNLSGTNSGDAWNFAESKTITVVSPTAIKNERILPQQLTLSGNYPNPFNPSTRIRFYLPATAHVRLDVFSLTGKKVAGLIDEALTAGAHDVTFHAGNLPSGVYIYRLSAAGRTLTGKMSLIR
ncbi:MAG: T9SS C-terminal target domain-containing protein [Calditrichaeota bacterium]|nr:MAG: T9SS C-terminal target domain-containing protein [Calditrichota bacterium]